MRSRMTCPSVCGLRPRFEARIAFSTAITSPRSQTLICSRRGSGTVTEPTWFKRHGGAIGVDMDRFEQRGGGASGAQAAEIMLQRLDRAAACGA